MQKIPQRAVNLTVGSSWWWTSRYRFQRSPVIACYSSPNSKYPAPSSRKDNCNHRGDKHVATTAACCLFASCVPICEIHNASLPVSSDFSYIPYPPPAPRRYLLGKRTDHRQLSSRSPQTRSPSPPVSFLYQTPSTAAQRNRSVCTTRLCLPSRPNREISSVMPTSHHVQIGPIGSRFVATTVD